jgi:hypothetical protein
VIGKVDTLERVNLHSHKGFDHRVVRRIVDRHLEIVRTEWLPLSWLRGVGASTVIWHCRPRPAG